MDTLFEKLNRLIESTTFRLTYLLFILAAGLVLVGQLQFFSQDFLEGIVATTSGVLLVLIGLVGEEKIRLGSKAGLRGIQRLAQKLEGWVQKNKPTLAVVQPGLLAAAPGKAEVAVGPITVVVAEAATAAKVAVEVRIPKTVIWVLGGLLLAASQPFLFLEQFILGLGLLLPGLALLGFAFTSKTPEVTLGRLDLLLKTVILGIAGLAAIGIGDYLMYKEMELHFAKELIGYLLNALGVFMLLALLPRVLPDSEPEAKPLLDAWTGEAKQVWHLAVKAGLVGLSVLFFYLSGYANQDGNFNLAVVLALLALASLGFSFPWSMQAAAAGESNALINFLLRIFRLGAFGAALYLAYQGQTLIFHEQVYPGFYRYGFAVILLLIAFRQPKAEGEDRLKEKPMKWYWEGLLLLAVLAGATWLRLYLLDSLPFGIECDEAGAGYHAVDILKNQFNSLTVHPSGRPLFMLLGKVVAFKFFGIDNIGMRLSAAIYGILGVFALYLLTRFLYGPRVALATAAMFAVSRWHIHFSRFGWANTDMVLLQILGFYFLFKGITARHKWYFVFSGVTLMLSVHTETASRMIPFICVGILGYFFLSQRHFLRRNWKPLVAMLLGVWLVGANLFIFWVNKPQYLFNRVYEVSVFSGDANAPREMARGLVESARLSLTQMNWHGDTRTRHNGGLSGEPVLDFWSAILFTLGFGLAVYYWRRMRHGVLMFWFFGFICASIFAVEAPQSHRAFGAVPAVFIFAGAFLDGARRLLREQLGRVGSVLGLCAFLVLMVPITSINYHKYFDTFPGFDTNCTATARYMGKVWPKAYHAIMSAYLWMGHPPFILYARDVAGNFYFDLGQLVPFRMDTQKDVVFTAIFEYPPLIPLVQYFYPKGIFKEEVHPKFELLYRSWAVKHEDIMATRGLNARYYNNVNWEGEPALERKDEALDITFDAKTWPLKQSGSVAWEGTILIPHWGDYTFYLYAKDYAEVRIDNKLVLTTSDNQEKIERVKIAGGLHRIRARARHSSPNGRLLLAWSSESGFAYHFNPLQDVFVKAPVAKNHLFTYRQPVGFLATYYGNDRWEGKPRLQMVEPAIFYFWYSPYDMTPPISATYRSTLTIEQAGDYAFNFEQGGFAEIEIDGKVIYRQGPVPIGWKVSDNATGITHLTPGPHRFFIRWSVKSSQYCKFTWTPPGGKPAVIPPQYLMPDAE